MDVQLTTRNLDVTPRLQEYVEKKVAKLDRYLLGIDQVRVDLAVENTRSSAHRQVAQLTLWVGGTMLRAEERAADMFSAIDAALDKLQRQIARFKKRRQDRRQRAGEEAAAEMEEAATGRIVRVKQFEVTMMTTDQAIEQMELLGHQFFVFVNSENEQINVVYRREDGNYGLIVPQVE